MTGTVRKRIVLLLCITAITLITIDVRGGSTGPVGALRSGVREVFSPLQKGVNAVTNPVNNFLDGVFHASELKAENKRLRREITEVNTKNKTYEAAVSENTRLQKLLNLVSDIDVPTTTSRVITGSSSIFETTAQIDKGTRAGIKIGDPVVDGDGLIGRVIETSSSRSTVLLITDVTSGVGVRDTRTNVVGIAVGQAGKTTLSMEFVDPDSTIQKGDTVVTSGLQDGRFPANIPVGTVRSVRKNPSGLTKEVILSPVVDINQISIVSVLHTVGAKG